MSRHPQRTSANGTLLAMATVGGGVPDERTIAPRHTLLGVVHVFSEFLPLLAAWLDARHLLRLRVLCASMRDPASTDALWRPIVKQLLFP